MQRRAGIHAFRRHSPSLKRGAAQTSQNLPVRGLCGAHQPHCQGVGAASRMAAGAVRAVEVSCGSRVFFPAFVRSGACVAMPLSSKGCVQRFLRFLHVTRLVCGQQEIFSLLVLAEVDVPAVPRFVPWWQKSSDFQNCRASRLQAQSLGAA